MQTKPKSNSVVTHERPADRPTVIIFKVKDAGEFELDFDKISPAVKARACIHGLVQRISDAAAIGRDPATGKPVADAPALKLGNMRRLADHYMSGSDDWSPAREASTGPGLDRLILAAVCEATGKTDAEVRLMVSEGSAKHAIAAKVYLESLAGAAKVRPIYERVKAEQASALAKAVTFDPDAELDEATGS